MKHVILFMTATCLVLLGACVRDDLSWKEQLDAQQKQLDEQRLGSGRSLCPVNREL